MLLPLLVAAYSADDRHGKVVLEAFSNDNRKSSQILNVVKIF